MTFAPILLLLSISGQTTSYEFQPSVPSLPTPRFAFCEAPNTSPRSPGLILTPVFRSRSDPDFIKTAFVNRLHASYAPYGNGWVFSEGATSCETFDTLRAADEQRGLRIARTPQPAATIFIVLFQIG